MTIRELIDNLNEMLANGEVNEDALVINNIIDDWGGDPIGWVEGEAETNTVHIWG